MVNPGDDKYRRLRLSNPKIAAAVVDVPGALDALLAMGWERDAADAGFLVCPKGVRVTMAEVRLWRNRVYGLSRTQPGVARCVKEYIALNTQEVLRYATSRLDV